MLFNLRLPLVCALFAGLVSSLHAQAQNNPPSEAELQWYRSQGSYLGDSLIQSNTLPDYYEVEPGEGYIVHPSIPFYMRSSDLVPRTDGPAYVTKLQDRSNDADLSDMKALYDEEAPRLTSDTGAIGQATVVTHNSAKEHAMARRDFEGESAVAQSLPIFEGAKNNRILGEVFSDCAAETSESEDGRVEILPTYKACAFVQLPLEPGYQGTLTRTVSVTIPEERGQETQRVTIPPGESAVVTGQLSDDFPPEVMVLSHIEVGVAPQSQLSYYTLQIQQKPMLTNGWEYKVLVKHSAEEPPPAPPHLAEIMFWISYDWEGAPEYSFSTACTDGDCGVAGDEFCKALWTCEVQAPVESGGHLIPASVVAAEPPLYPVDPVDDPDGANAAAAKVCMRASLNINCARIYSGMACWQDDPSGSQTCEPVADPGVLPNTCGPLEDNPVCSVTHQGCAEDGFSDISQWCYVRTRVYACAEHVTVPNEEVTIINRCGGAQPCLDGSCTTTNRRYEARYSRPRAVAEQVVIQHFLSDYTDPATLTGNAAPTAEAEAEEVRVFLEQARAYEQAARPAAGEQ